MITSQPSTESIPAAEKSAQGISTVVDAIARLEEKIVELRESQANGPQRWIDVDGAARYSSLSVKSIRRLIATQKLTGHRPVRGRLVIDLRELDALIQGSANRAPRRGRGISAATIASR